MLIRVIPKICYEVRTIRIFWVLLLPKKMRRICVLKGGSYQLHGRIESAIIFIMMSLLGCQIGPVKLLNTIIQAVILAIIMLVRKWGRYGALLHREYSRLKKILAMHPTNLRLERTGSQEI